jgi:hypothetical protein
MLGKNLTWNGRVCLGFTEPTNCSNINWTNGTNTSDSCYCISNFYWDNTFKLCRANCSAIANAISPTSFTSCSCADKFFWDGFLCRINCSNISWTNGTNTNNSCYCISGYYWNSSTCVCRKSLTYQLFQHKLDKRDKY